MTYDQKATDAYRRKSKEDILALEQEFFKNPAPISLSSIYLMRVVAGNDIFPAKETNATGMVRMH